MSSFIRQEGTIESVQNSQIILYSSNTFNDFDYSILSTVVFENPQLNTQLYANSISSEIEFGSAQLNQSIIVQSIESTVSFQIEDPIFKYLQTIYLDGRLEVLQLEKIQDFSETQIQTLIDQYERSIQSTAQFSNDNELRVLIRPNSIESEVLFGNTNVISIISLSSVESTVEFGNSQINMEIQDVPFPSIESTLVIPQPNVLKVIGPLSIAPTASFGISSFINNIHRLLIFKDDNISKVGENDAVVIAGGIRLNPASVVSESASAGQASLPEAPVGFLSVNINGTDYKIPYYNS